MQLEGCRWIQKSICLRDKHTAQCDTESCCNNFSSLNPPLISSCRWFGQLLVTSLYFYCLGKRRDNPATEQWNDAPNVLLFVSAEPCKTYWLKDTTVRPLQIEIPRLFMSCPFMSFVWVTSLLKPLLVVIYSWLWSGWIDVTAILAFHCVVWLHAQTKDLPLFLFSIVCLLLAADRRLLVRGNEICVNSILLLLLWSSGTTESEGKSKSWGTYRMSPDSTCPLD